MQYVQRKLQRSVTEIRKSRKARPRVSASVAADTGLLCGAMVCNVVMAIDSAGYLCAVLRARQSIIFHCE